ncbi:MAG: hypothetical protein ACTHQM_23585 [Thermoanaerobaculia bacterium]
MFVAGAFGIVRSRNSGSTWQTIRSSALGAGVAMATDGPGVEL